MKEKLEKFTLNLEFTRRAEKTIQKQFAKLNLNENRNFSTEDLFEKVIKPGEYYYTEIKFYDRGNKNDDIYDIRIPKSENRANKELLDILKIEEIVLECIEKENNFKVKSIRLYHDSKIITDRIKKVYLKFYTPKSKLYLKTGFPDGFLEELKIEKVTGENFKKNIDSWKFYLEASLLQAKKKNFNIDYKNHIKFLGKGEIEFTLKKFSDSKLKEKIYDAYNKSLYIHYCSADNVKNDNDSEGVYIGDLKSFDFENLRLKIDLDEKTYKQLKNNKLKLPLEASLEYKPVGSLTNIKRQLKAIERAENFKAANKRLAAILFDAENLKLSKNKLIIEDKEFFNHNLNDKQKKAVEKIINTEELTLIKGPPGTGKTTVITEACYQLAKHNKKVLISSQTNLAVDNVFSNLKDIMSQGEKVYPFRFGRLSDFEEEGEGFAEENVVSTWLKDSAQNSKEILNKKISKIKDQQAILETMTELKEYLRLVKQKKKLSKRLVKIKSDIKNLNSLLNYNYYFQILNEDYQIYSDIYRKKLELENRNLEMNEMQNEIEEKEKTQLSIEKEYLDLKNKIKEIDNYTILLAKDNSDYQKWLKSNIDLKAESFNLDYQTLPSNILSHFEKLDFQKNWESFRDEYIQDFKKIMEAREKNKFLAEDIFALKKIRDLLLSFRKDIEKNNDINISSASFKYGGENIFKNYFELDDGKIKAVKAGSYRKISLLLNSSLETEEKEKIFYQLKILIFKLNKRIELMNDKLKSFQIIKEDPYQLLTDKFIEILTKKLKAEGSKSKAKLTILEAKLNKTNSTLDDFKLQKEVKIEEIRNLKNEIQLPEKLKLLIKIEKEIVGFEDLKSLYGYFIKLLNSGDINTKWQEEFNKIENRLNNKLIENEIEAANLNQSLKDKETELLTLKNKMEFLKENLDFFQLSWQEKRKSIKYFADEAAEPAISTLEDLIKRTESDLKDFQEDKEFIKRYEKTINDWSESIAEINLDNRELLSLYLEKVNIVGATCSKAASYKLLNKFSKFDYVIIDEVSKATIPELLMSIIKAEKVILIGDDKQLPPLVSREIIDLLKSNSAPFNEKLLKGSYFKKLWQEADPSVKVMLNKQYRMHSDIMSVINQFYENELVSGIRGEDELKNHTLELEYLKNDQHVIWIQTPQNEEWREEKVNTSYKNIKEFKIIDKILADIDKLREKESFKEEIGVITFYKPQYELFRKRLLPRYKDLNLRLGTVDRFQGMESDIVIVSMVRNNEQQNIGFAKKFERINVALSRARKLLIMVGDSQLFCSDNYDDKSRKIYSNIASTILNQGGVIDASEVIYS